MRITIKHLRPLVDRLNRTAGTPSEPWTCGERWQASLKHR
jgi:hypothetical protein